jgi:hypothetical protein
VGRTSGRFNLSQARGGNTFLENYSSESDGLNLERFEGASTAFARKRSQPYCPHIRWWLLHLSFELKVTISNLSTPNKLKCTLDQEPADSAKNASILIPAQQLQRILGT